MGDLPKRYKIAVIGASVSGLTLVLSLLHPLAHDAEDPPLSASDILILESRSRDAPVGGPLTLAPNGQRILDRLRILSQIQALGYPHHSAVTRDSQGTYLGEVPYGDKDRWGYDALRIERAVLVDVLKSELYSRGGKVEFDCSVREIVSEDESGVTFRVRSGDKISGELVEMRAEVLIGADGIHSKTRTFVHEGCEVKPMFGGVVMIGAKANFSKMRYGDVFEEARKRNERCLGVSTDKGAVMMIPSDPAGEDFLFIRQFPVSERSRQEWAAFDADKSMLKDMMTQDQGTGVFPEIIESLLEQTQSEQCYIWPGYTLPKLERWVSPGRRVVIIGDAAHAVNPASGQGANQAIEDAFTLAKILKDSLSEEKLLEWQQRRMQRLENVAQLGVQIMNLRLPPEQRAKLPKELVFDLEAAQGDQMRWLYGSNLTEEF